MKVVKVPGSAGGNVVTNSISNDGAQLESGHDDEIVGWDEERQKSDLRAEDGTDGSHPVYQELRSAANFLYKNLWYIRMNWLTVIKICINLICQVSLMQLLLSARCLKKYIKGEH